MEIFHSEFLKNYETYTFGYTSYAVLAAEDLLSEAYQRGYLPYAGSSEYESDKIREIFYMARSLRINLTNYSLSSENRRVVRKADPFQLDMSIGEKEDYMDNEDFNSFCQEYAAERFKGGDLDTKRWDYVLKRRCGNQIFEFKIDNKSVGYALVGIDANSLHYWFSFFDTSYMDQFPIGKYMMSQVIEWAHAQDKKHVYLGTCYGPHSLYKARDFKGTEYFDGSGWSNNINQLKHWCKNENEISSSDRYKMPI